MWCMNECYQNGPYLLDQNHQTTTNANKQFHPCKGRNLLGSIGWGEWPLRSPTRFLRNDQEKSQLLEFMGFCPKQWRHGIVDPIFD